jgi:regulator of replication initiation timing
VYIVLLGVAAIVYALMQPRIKQQGAAAPAAQVGDIEHTLEQYMAEMERDNEEIIGLIADMKQETVAKQLSLQEQVAELRQRLQTFERQNLLLETKLEQLQKEPPANHVVFTEAEQEAAPAGATAEATEAIGEHAAKSPTVRERYPELFELYDQGKSIDIVSKSIGMAKGEVQLILQLAKREESL